MPQALQLAALEALSHHTDSSATEAVFQRWGGFSPSVRDTAVKLLTSRTQATTALLDAVERGTVSRSDLTAAQQQSLREHPVIEVRRRAERIWKSDVVGDRGKLVAAWDDALELDGDAKRGREVFVKTCAQCHRADGAGYAVGPDLVSVRNKSPEDLVVAILDPNREWQPNFTSYNVLTTDGQVFSGLVVAETATSLTLRQPEAKETTVLRANVELMKSGGKSLMPEGVEKEVTRQQLADVIAFVKTLSESP
jgi:putative heme-binding domain-containing protein